MSEVLSAVADAMVERVDVDWQRARDLASDPRETATLASLQEIASLAGGRLGATLTSHGLTSPSLGVLTAGLLGALVTTVGLSSASLRFVLAPVDVSPLPFVVVLSFAGVAVALWTVGQHEARVIGYAAVCMLTAAAFSRVALSLGAAVPVAGLPARWLQGVYPETFAPAVLWEFAQRFPYTRRFSRLDQMARVGRMVAAGFGLVAFVVNAGSQLVPGLTRNPLAVPFVRSNPFGSFWVLFYVLSFPALICIAARCWYAETNERRRVATFGAALVAGMAPLVIAGVLQVESSHYRALMANHSFVTRAVDVAVWIGLISVPILTGLSVVLQQALPLRLIMADALKFIVARNSLRVIGGTLALFVVGRLVRERDQPLSESLAWFLSYPAVSLGVWIALLVGHKSISRWADKTLARRIVDHQQVAATAVLTIAAARDRYAAVAALSRELRRAFSTNAIWVVTRVGDAWIDTGATLQQLPAQSSLPWLSIEPEAISVRPGSSMFDLLPREDREWVVESGVDLVTIVGKDEPWAIIAIGTRADGQSYGRSDRLLAATPSAAAASAAPECEADAEQRAFECPTCGIVTLLVQGGCPCGTVAVPAELPKRVSAKFEVLRRVGAGGMGVVYLASDTLIGRRVALKTLHVRGLDRTQRVLNEARAMAATEHPHLAQIYSVEIVRAAPVLVVEWMPDGTLADRLAKGRLGWRDAMMVSLDIVSALAHLHDAGLVHRDVKPSNIAFAANGQPKLLDFGLAVGADPQPDPANVLDICNDEATSAAWSRSLVGTPLYLSPELLSGASGGPYQDLWALSLVLYESLAGRNPFAGATLTETIGNVRAGTVPDIRQVAPETPTSVAAFVTGALSRDRSLRPQSASEMRATMSSLVAS